MALNSTLSNQPTVNPKNIPAILLAGTISMFFAEVMAGSSSLWFVEFFGIANTYILYLTHLLFYLNLAVRTKKTSLPQLYVWGMLFGLYEAPITQVLWSGYMNESGASIMIFGIAVIEFIVLVFFWHPVMSFMIPILIYETLVYDFGNENSQLILPNHSKILQKLKKFKGSFFVLLMLLSIGQVSGSGYNLVVALGAICGSIALILIFWGFTKRNAQKNQTQLGINNLILSSRGFNMLIAFMLIYVYGWIIYFISTILPGRWPDLIGYVTISVIIVIILIRIWCTPPILSETNNVVYEHIDHISGSDILPSFKSKDVYTLFGGICFTAFIYLLVPTFTMMMINFVYISFILMGIIFVILNIKGLNRLNFPQGASSAK